MKPASIVLYIGTSIAGLITLICIIGLPRLSRTATIILWCVAFATLITGSLMDKFMKEEFCCGKSGDYVKIFQTPMNAARDPTNVNPLQIPLKRNETNEYTRNQYARHGVRANKISHQYRYAY
tara:strand:+ start:29 stop:397 length:369 start_codon:yes stop_codon:yes gene_type:complete